ncbi:MAG TPA: hypothetical protein VN781_10160 [Acidimicrobiales bacterium]|nr:hypothetical protein [Acidimicrobiales bacterium]
MRTRWWSPRAIGLHVVLLIVVPTFLVLCDWQVRRALGGNELSWAYVFEWPFFAGYAVFVWWKLVHETLLPNDGSGTQSEVADPPGTELERTEATEEDPEEDPELAAYNRYLAELHAHGRPKRW